MAIGLKSGKKPNIIIVIAAAVLALAVILGAVLGITVSVKNARAVLRYEGVRLNEGVVNYLAATFKSDYMHYLKTELQIDTAEDSEFFWSLLASEDGKTYGDMLTERISLEIRTTTVGAYLFDRNASLSREQKSALKLACEEVLDYKAGGDVERFNEISASFGFDYEDFCFATELLYKESLARNAIFGFDGQVLSLEGYEREREEFLSTYSHVKLLFVNTDKGYKKNDDGSYTEYTLTDSQRAERFAEISEIRKLISGVGTDTDEDVMSSIMFDALIEEHPFNDNHDKGGFYFSPTADYSLGFEGAYPGVVLTALNMEEGEYEEVAFSEGVCFIYKYSVEPYAYVVSSNSEFFDDFYYDLADYVYYKSKNELSKDVEEKDYFKNFDYLSVGCNWDLVATVGAR